MPPLQTDSGSAALSCALTRLTVPSKPAKILDSGWDIHDTVYSRELLISNKSNGYRDILASIDLSTYRRIPWENNVPFFLVSFFDPDTKEPLVVDPRGTLKKANDRAKNLGYEAYAGCEYEVCGLPSAMPHGHLTPLLSSSTSKVRYE